MGKAVARKRLARSPKTGQFEPGSPLNDPALLDFAVRTFRALDHLEPIFRRIAEGEAAGINSSEARAYAFVGVVLAAMREDIREQLMVDRQALRDATKPLLTAARLYPSLGISDAALASVSPERRVL